MTTIYSTQATAIGGREGNVKTADGKFDLKFSMPKNVEGTSPDGTNPEQLFSMGYAACFDGALNLVASMKHVKIASETTAKVSLCKNDEGGFDIAVDISVLITGVDQAVADDLVATAHQVCPYSRATRNNVAVSVSSKIKA